MPLAPAGHAAALPPALIDVLAAHLVADVVAALALGPVEGWPRAVRVAAVYLAREWSRPPLRQARAGGTGEPRRATRPAA